MIKNNHFWFDDSDPAWGDGLLDSTSPVSEHLFSTTLQSLTATMQDYFDRKSRAPSPSVNRVSRMWYSAPPNLADHNKDIVKIFLSLFRKHVPRTIPIFRSAIFRQKDRAAYTLAMAATGGMFCKLPGSATVAKSMYNDARRLLLASVRFLKCEWSSNVLMLISSASETRQPPKSHRRRID